MKQESREGVGRFVWNGGMKIYEGQYKNDLRNGYGRFIFPNGSYYLGYWKDNLYHG